MDNVIYASIIAVTIITVTAIIVGGEDCVQQTGLQQSERRDSELQSSRGADHLLRPGHGTNDLQGCAGMSVGSRDGAGDAGMGETGWITRTISVVQCRDSRLGVTND